MSRTSEYRTISGRRFELRDLDNAEQRFLAVVHKKFDKGPGWSAFGSWWVGAFTRARLPRASATYRICQDLEARLGIAQGMVAPPDYRDYLADLIEDRYGSRYRFCKETGVDPGHLSRVFASRSELSLQSLQQLLKVLGATLVVQPQEVTAAEVSPKRAAQALAAATR